MNANETPCEKNGHGVSGFLIPCGTDKPKLYSAALAVGKKICSGPFRG